jgi:hypothetical protein
VDRSDKVVTSYNNVKKRDYQDDEQRNKHDDSLIHSFDLRV